MIPYDNPDSGMFVNDLQGITTSQIECISDDEDHYDIKLAWDDIYNRASRLLETDIKNSLKKYFKRYSYVDNGITGQLYDNKSIPQSNSLSGVRFNFGYQSKNLSINVSKFDLYLSSQSDFTLYIYDLNTGHKIDEISYEGSIGLKTYNVGKNYAVHRYSDLFVCYDANVVDTLKMTDYKPTSFVSNGQIDNTELKVSSNFSGANTGISVVYNLDCSVSNFVCQRIDSFSLAFQYKLGVEVCNERLYTDRINRYSLLDRDDAETLRREFQDQYQLLIDAALKDLKVTENDECFECSKSVNYKPVLP